MEVKVQNNQESCFTVENYRFYKLQPGRTRKFVGDILVEILT